MIGRQVADLINSSSPAFSQKIWQGRVTVESKVELLSFFSLFFFCWRWRRQRRMLQEQGNSSLPSSSERSSSSALQMEVKEGIESDEEIRRVPDFGFELAGPSTSGREAASAAGPERAHSTAQSGQRRRGRSPADKEHKRLKRLLRNRVSAQQARERKKAYLNDLEVKVKDLEARNSELEERMSTLQNENNMLRQILKNTTVGRRGSGSNVSGEGM